MPQVAAPAIETAPAAKRRPLQVAEVPGHAEVAVCATLVAGGRGRQAAKWSQTPSRAEAAALIETLEVAPSPETAPATRPRRMQVAEAVRPRRGRSGRRGRTLMPGATAGFWRRGQRKCATADHARRRKGCRDRGGYAESRGVAAVRALRREVTAGPGAKAVGCAGCRDCVGP